MPSKTWIKGCFGMVGLSIVSLAWYLATPPPTLLLQRAVKVTNMNSWYPMMNGKAVLNTGNINLIAATQGSVSRRWEQFESNLPYGRHYLWLSNREILFLLREGTYPMTGWEAPTILRRDINTGDQEVLLSLNRRIQQSGKAPRNFELSPDRQRFLWVASGKVHSANLDGSHYEAWPLSHFNLQQYEDPNMGMMRPKFQVRWLPDSRGWLALINSAWYTEDDPPKHIEYYAHQHTIGFPKKDAILSLADRDLLQTDTVFLTPDRLLGIPCDRIPGEPSYIEDRMGAKIERSRSYKFTASFDPETYLGNFKVSPQKDRIAWLQHSPVPPPFLSRWIPWLRPKSLLPTETSTQIYMSNLDGSNRRILGKTDYPMRKGDLGGPMFTSVCLLEWLPDGKHLSFVLNDELWVVPVP